MSSVTEEPRSFTLNFTGDVMLGRLIDQMFPVHVDCPEEARIARSFLSSHHPTLTQGFRPETPWGDALPLLKEADLTLINLETAVTTHDRKWPDKVFNYRMHPSNVAALKAAEVDYVGLANNHTLDFSEAGLDETVKTVQDAGFAFAGAGESQEEARRAAVLTLPSGSNKEEFKIHVWAASDHPSDWRDVPGFHFIDYSQQTRERLKQMITSNSPPTSNNQTNAGPPDLKIFSVHWGPNYEWQPSSEVRSLSHFLVDECGIDIVHGHSSHHVRGVEVYNGSLIIYGCGDFVDDYALVENYRNDLGAVWRVHVKETIGRDHEMEGKRLRVERLEVFPTKIDKFVVRRLKAGEEDAKWVREKIKDLSFELGTMVEVERDGDGRVIVNVS